MRTVRIERPELTHDRAVLHLGLAVLALGEWASIHGAGVFRSRFWFYSAVVAWVVVVYLLGTSRSWQPHAVEAWATFAVALTVGVGGVFVTGVGSHYWTHAHPVGTLAASVVRASFGAACMLTWALVLESVAEWWRLRGTTPEERVLEGER